MDYRISDDGITTPVTSEEVTILENVGVIYFCPEHACWHVTPDFEEYYRMSTGPFLILKPVPVDETERDMSHIVEVTDPRD